MAETQQAQTDKLVWSLVTQKAFQSVQFSRSVLSDSVTPWIAARQKAFKALQIALLQASTLNLPTGSEFSLFVTENKGYSHIV